MGTILGLLLSAAKGAIVDLLLGYINQERRDAALRAEGRTQVVLQQVEKQRARQSKIRDVDLSVAGRGDAEWLQRVLERSRVAGVAK